MNRLKKLSLIALVIAFATEVNAQIVGTAAYIPALHVGIGIDGAGGFEGADTNAFACPPGMRPRSNTNYLGFVADPGLTGWATYDGDFFTPGTPENGWGMELLDGAVDLKLSNNRSGGLANIPGAITDWEYSNGCYTATWDGDYVGSGYDMHWKIVYTMNENDTYYNTSVTITNNGSTTLPDLYYYRNLDPDNNVTLSGSYTTTNTIVSQPSGTCSKALVSATQSTPWSSYFGLAAVGDDFRVSLGGFSNRDATDIWNGVGGMTGTVGTVSTMDEAVSLAYRMQNITPGESRNFKFVVILDAAQADNAINNLFYFSFMGSITGPPPACVLDIDSTTACSGLPLQVTLQGSAVNDFSWTWTPTTGLDTAAGVSVEVLPTSPTLYTIIGTPISSCFTFNITQSIFVDVLPGPELGIVPPATCGTFDLADLVWVDSNSVAGTVTNWYTDPPVNANDTTDLYTGTSASTGDTLYFVIGDPALGCIDYEMIVVGSSDIGANVDNIVDAICGQPNGSLTVSGTGGSGPYTYDIGGTSQASPVFNGLVPGTYTVTVTDSAGCANNTTAVVSDSMSIDGNVVSTENALCLSPTGEVTVQGTLGTGTFSYTFDGVTNTTGAFTSVAPGTDSVLVTSGTCSTMVVFTVGQDPINIDLGPDQTFCNYIVLSPNTAGTYLWNTGDTTAAITVTESGEYIVTVNAIGCSDSDTINVTVIPNVGVVIPNVFTPGGDGKNDKFKVVSQFVDTYEVWIYNRWGQEVYHSTDVDGGWDGDFDGKEAADGAYMVMIKYVDPCAEVKDITYTGTVQLFRKK